MSSPTQTVHLKATYTSPSTDQQPHILSSTPLELPVSASDVDSKTAYLRSLRAATVTLQERINAELTARMEEDNKNAAAQAGNAVDEAAEEENYGEEVQEDDEV